MVESLSDKQGKKVYVALSLYRLWLKEPQYVLYHHLYHNSHHLLYITTCKPTTSSKQLKLNRCHCLCYNINILYSHSQHPHCHWPKLNLYQNSHYLWYHNQHYKGSCPPPPTRFVKLCHLLCFNHLFALTIFFITFPVSCTMHIMHKVVCIILVHFYLIIRVHSFFWDFSMNHRQSCAHWETEVQYIASIAEG